MGTADLIPVVGLVVVAFLWPASGVLNVQPWNLTTPRIGHGGAAWGSKVYFGSGEDK
jgi:hypothetical protein